MCTLVATLTDWPVITYSIFRQPDRRLFMPVYILYYAHHWTNPPHISGDAVIYIDFI